MFDLKQWAAANKVSNSQLCRLSGVSECTIASVMRGCSCTERTLKRICRGIGRPYDPAEWKNPVKASLKPVPVVDYDRVRNYRDRRSMEELKRNLAVGETINDMDGEIVNFFSVCREHPEELARAINLTPWARQELKESQVVADDPVERARRTAVGCYMTFGARRCSRSFRHTTSKTKNGGPVMPSSCAATGNSQKAVKWSCRPRRQMGLKFCIMGRW